MKKLLILFLFISSNLFATNYYIKTGGSDEANGLTDGTAWATCSKVSGFTFSAGDSVFFNRGDVWRETLTIHNSGTAAGWIYYGSYGTGLKPQILGSVLSITWSDMGGNIWKSATSVTDPCAAADKGSEIFFISLASDTIWGRQKKADTSLCVVEYDWTWSANYLYVYAATDPDERYTAIEAPQRTWGIDLSDEQFIHIDSLDVHFAQNGLIGGGSYPTPDKSWIKITNNNLSYCGRKDGSNLGISAVYSNMIISGNRIHDIGRRSISIYGYGNGGFTTNNIQIYNNEMFNGFHTTGVDISCGSGSFTSKFDSIAVYNNLIYDSPTASVTAPEGGTPELINIESYYNVAVRISNVYIHNNILKYPANSGIHIYGLDTVKIYNNTFYGHNEVKTSNTFHINITSYCTEVDIKNNIFYTPLAASGNGQGVILYESSAQDATEITADYNMYYRSNAAYVTVTANGTDYHYNDLATIRTVLGWEAHGQFADPLFTSSSDYNLQAESPAIGTAISVEGFTTDFYGNAINAEPDMGAIAYDSDPPTPTDLPVVETSLGVIKSITGTMSGNVTSDGGGTIIARGFVWSVSINPTINGSGVSKITFTGTTGYFTGAMRGLIGGTTYHVRAYATNESGTSYGADISFTTPVYTQGYTNGKIGLTNGKPGVHK